ncbi:MAG: type II secretion system protein [Planctomycetota bacterium]|jgi:prepilin-type N-terminal cleavage/methylation domain-containing protein
MSKSKGFTLIELLVVISIIALLMAILLPTLSRAKEQATEVLCQTRLKQWATIWAMYTGDNDDFFHPGQCRLNPQDYRKDQLWLNATYKYYMGQDELLFCPAADGPISNAAFGAVTDVALLQKGIWGPSHPGQSGRPGVYGSLGLNQWVANPVNGKQSIGGISSYWKTPSAKNSADVPIMGDACFERVFPRYTDPPPPYELAIDHGNAGGDRPLSQFCINRHNSKINLLFMDSSIRKIGLKSLWNYNWRPNWNIENQPPPVWPHWMRKFRD